MICQNDILPLSPRDIPRAADAFADGFSADPVYTMILRGETAPRSALRDFFGHYITECKGLRLYRYKQGDGYLAIYFSDEIGEGPAGHPVARRLAPHLILEDHYENAYGVLDLMTVRRESRGRGIAGGMIRFFITECEARGVTPLVEIFDGGHIPLYEKYGFTVAHQKTVDGVTTYVLEKRK